MMDCLRCGKPLARWPAHALCKRCYWWMQSTVDNCGYLRREQAAAVMLDLHWQRADTPSYGHAFAIASDVAIAAKVPRVSIDPTCADCGRWLRSAPSARRPGMRCMSCRPQNRRRVAA